MTEHVAGTIKPLEWVEDTESVCTRAFAPALGGKMIVVELDPGSGEYSAGIDLSGLCFRLIQADYKDDWGIPYSAPAKYSSIEEAKAAAEGDYIARIRSALVPAPSVPDDVAQIVAELRVIGCHENGDARCTCGIAMDAADALEALSAEVGGLRMNFIQRDGRSTSSGTDTPMTTNPLRDKIAAGSPEWHLATLLSYIVLDPSNLKGLQDNDTMHMDVRLRIGDVRDAYKVVLQSFGSDGNEEARWIKDTENACPACGGSGHKDDAPPSPQPTDNTALVEDAADLVNFGSEVWIGKWKDRALKWMREYHALSRAPQPAPDAVAEAAKVLLAVSRTGGLAPLFGEIQDAAGIPWGHQSEEDVMQAVDDGLRALASQKETQG